MGAKDILKKAFPFLSTAAIAFGGPIGQIGASALGQILDKPVRPEALEKELTDLTLTDEGRAKGQQAEEKFKTVMGELGIKDVTELERITIADRDSARKREMAVKDRMPMILGLAVNAAFFGVLAALIFKVVPQESRDILLVLVGALTASWKDTYGYYFGSSAGSARKDEIIGMRKGDSQR